MKLDVDSLRSAVYLSCMTTNPNGDEKMTKKDAIKLLENFAHLANSMQLHCESVPVESINEFWDLIDQLPSDIRESVIN
jgi:hypothetical protein